MKLDIKPNTNESNTPAHLNLIGKKSGLLTVVESLGIIKRQRKWLCKCECGNTRTISTGEFNRNRSPVLSCGCYHVRFDLTGKQLQNFKVVKFVPSKKFGSQWLCVCICGNEKVLSYDSLVVKKTQSCGCLNKSGTELHLEKCKKRLLESLDKKKSGCWVWKGRLTKDGYGYMPLWGLNIQRAHRASWFLHFGNLPKDKLVLHKCDNKPCCNPDHLYLGTPKDNSKDALERGQFPKGPNKKKGHIGELNCKAKLSIDKVKYIKFICDNNFKISEIASFFGVHKSTIRNIHKRKTWAFV